MRFVVATASIVMGLGIAGIWSKDLLAGKVDLSSGVWRSRDPDDGTLFWPHWLAEYGTAGLLVVGGIGIAAATEWSVPVAAGSLGALLYTSINSLGWAFARPERRVYAAPMMAGVVVGLVGLGWLIA
jgi:hypothetical protein